jgi:hypothetical protein
MDIKIGDRTVTVNVRSAKNFLRRNGLSNAGSLTNEMIEKLLQTFVEQKKWEKISSNYSNAENKKAYEDLGLSKIFRAQINDPDQIQNALKAFQKTVRDQLALLSDPEKKAIDQRKLLLGDSGQIHLFRNTLLEALRLRPERTEQMAKALGNLSSEGDVLRQARSFNEFITGKWSSYWSERGRNIHHYKTREKVLEEVLNGTNPDALKDFLQSIKIK